MSKPMYTVEARRDGNWWTLVVPELDRVYSQSKRLDQADAAIREVIEGVHDQKPDSYDLRIDLEPTLGSIAASVREMNAKAEAATAQARATQLAAIGDLREMGLPQRDVGEILGLSHQRVAQLAKR